MEEFEGTLTVIFEATDATYHSQVISNKKYNISDLRFGYRFNDILEVKDGFSTVNWGKFDKLVEINVSKAYVGERAKRRAPLGANDGSEDRSDECYCGASSLRSSCTPRFAPLAFLASLLVAQGETFLIANSLHQNQSKSSGTSLAGSSERKPSFYLLPPPTPPTTPRACTTTTSMKSPALRTGSNRLTSPPIAFSCTRRQ